ncbi:MAG TPA: hypothetical protein VNZ52_16550 [Candidatus Thermoplasmatota archaeon]|nr:hypothetical protein [Candidatus Thermoplasmatota archaeon]
MTLSACNVPGCVNPIGRDTVEPVPSVRPWFAVTDPFGNILELYRDEMAFRMVHPNREPVKVKLSGSWRYWTEDRPL